MTRRILGAAIGACVHVAGVLGFLRVAEEQGYEVEFLGAALPIPVLLDAIQDQAPNVVGIGYRLNIEGASRLFGELAQGIQERSLTGTKFVFGGTPSVARLAKETGIFDRVFSGSETSDDVISYLRRRDDTQVQTQPPGTLLDRISSKRPFPLIRHHFGLPSLEDTIDGARVLAEARVLDVLSLGPDQNAQEHFMRPKEMRPEYDGAGGVPVRSEDDFRDIYEASRCGNYPLVRCYNGTRDLMKMAKMLLRTIHNAWCVLPLSWYSVLDGRSNRRIGEAAGETQEVIRFHAEQGIPVEVNEAHQWSLRGSHDTVAVVMAFLAAYNAKKMGVRDYVAQYMFNTPLGMSPAMDLAKMLAKIELIEGLHDDNFVSHREVRPGLLSFPSDPNLAKGQLAASVYLSMALRPEIVHVVAYSEGDHAATPEEIIESCRIAKQVIDDSLMGLPDMTLDSKIQERKTELVQEAGALLEAMRGIAPEGTDDPWGDSRTLEGAIQLGFLDAPDLKGSQFARGTLVTRIIGGSCVAYDPINKRPLNECERISSIVTRDS